MYLSELRLVNYSSFQDSGVIKLAPGINLFVGPNNSGKSALLRAIVPPMLDNPHRPVVSPYEDSRSRVELRVKLTLEELYQRLVMAGVRPIKFPMGGAGNQEYQRRLEHLLQAPDTMVEIECVRIAGQTIAPLNGASLSAFRDQTNQIQMQIGRNAQGFTFEGRPSGPDNLSDFFDLPSSESLFYFGAQRVNVGRVGISDEIALKPDASNLPVVLSHVQNTRATIFELIEQHLSEVLPGIERITVVPSGGVFEIFLWPKRSGPLSDLRFSLNDSGSGVGQLLAIICAVVLHKQSIIIIDEINTYLHPVAIKKLLRLIQGSYPQHQYIISAHSADVIFGSNPAALFTVRRDDLVSEVTSLELSTARDARRVAGLLGFSMLDVFGNDRIIWVEGPTEEVVFPLVLQAFGHPLRPEIGISAVCNASSLGDLKTRRDEVIAIYENAGKRMSPLLQGMAFGLDRERLTDEAVQKMQASKRKLRFLPRRCLENYFLDKAAIAAVMTELGEEVTAERIQEEIETVAGDAKFGAGKYWSGDVDDARWLRWIDGAKILAHVFATLSEQRLEFRKTRDTVSLARSLLRQDKDRLVELYDYVSNLVRIAEKDSSP